MVTFTCNNCGDSVKKNRVEKHFNFECKRKSGGPNLCCIDCLKDFRQNYEEHTSCKSENERYAAKGTYVENAPKNKQAKKQMTWSEIIQSVSDSNTGLNQSTKDILNLIKDNENVPRKEAKFKNFCKNNFHLRRFTANEISNVFNLLQEELKKNLETINAEKQKILLSNKENNQQEIKQINGKKRTIDENEDENEIKKKKIKSITEEKEEGVKENGIAKKKKKEKSSKMSIDEDQEKNVETNIEHQTDNLTNGESNKKKKKNKSIENNIQKMDVSVISDKNKEESKKKKKKNKERKNINGKVEIEGKKKKEEEDFVIDISQSENDLTQDSLNSSTKSKKSPKKKKKNEEPDRNQFRDIILKLLKPGTEFKIKSLKKMVFAVYKTGEQEVPKEVRENFNKKLSKIPNITVNEKIVKMVK